MNFHDLRVIVGQIKKGIRCGRCKHPYTDEDIDVIGTFGENQTLFHAVCIDCESEAIINVTLHFDGPLPAALPPLKKLGRAPRMGKVTVNDVLDVHNFLKDFNGEFSELFNEKS